MAGEKSGDLQDVNDLSRCIDFGTAVHVGEHRGLQFPPHLCQDFQASPQARAAISIDGCSIGFIVRTLVDKRNLQGLAGFFEKLRRLQGHSLIFNDARTPDHEKLVYADGLS